MLCIVRHMLDINRVSMHKSSTNQTNRVMLVEETKGNGNNILLHATHLNQNSEYRGFHQASEADPEPKLAQDGTKRPSTCVFVLKYKLQR